MVTICTNFVGAKTLTLNAKFEGNRPADLEEDDFKVLLPYMGMAAILVTWSGPFEQTLVHLSH